MKNLLKRKRMKKQIKTTSFVLTLLLLLQIISPILSNLETNISYAVDIPSINDTTATVTSSNSQQQKLFSGIGRYKLNYTGASNYYIDTNPKSVDSNGYSSLGLNGIEKSHDDNHGGNSSGAKLTISEGSSIKKAYLILQYNESTLNEVRKTADWYVTLSYNRTKQTSNFTPASSIKFKPQKILTGDGEKKYYNTVAYIEITDFIKQKGTGYYYCSNIPSKKDISGDLAASWKIVVIEKNMNNPIKAIELDVLYKFINTSSTMSYKTIEVKLPPNITTRNSSESRMEIIYGISNVDPEKGNNKLQYRLGGEEWKTPTVIHNGYTIRSENYATRFIYSINGKPVEQITNYPNTYYLDTSTLTNDVAKTGFTTIQNEFPITGDDTELINNIPIERKESSFSVRIGAKNRNIMINTLGVAVDIEGINYNSTQTTAISNGTSVTVTGRSTNTTAIDKIGVANGTYIVTLDNKITATSATASIRNSDGSTSGITGIIDNINHTVTFSNVNTLTKDTFINYTINGSVSNTYVGSTLNNRASYSGLYSNNNTTSDYIEDVTQASSSAVIPYVLSINPNGGIWNNSSNIQYSYLTSTGTKTIELPTRAGHTFTEWSLSGAGSTMSSLTANNATFTMGNANATLTANWTINSSNLQVNPNGGFWNNGTATQTFTQNYNTTKAIPVPTRTGYTFTGWSRTGNYGTLSSTTANATYTFGATNNVTDILTANWEKKSYQLEVQPNGGNWKGGTSNQKITINYQGTEIIPVPTRNGYSFSKWTLAGEGSKMSSLTANNAIFTMGTSNATLTANWERNTYQLELRPNGGSWNGSEENQVFPLAYEQTKTIPVPNRKGYEFVNWTLEGQETENRMSSLTEEAIFTMGYSNARLTANWRLLTHNINGNIIWNDEENKYTSRPSAIEVTLHSDEPATEEGVLQTPSKKTVTREQYEFENLQTKKIKDNTNYKYTVSQNKVPGYETLINGYDITNHLIVPQYVSQINTTPENNLENEFIKNEKIQIVGIVTASNTNRDKVGLVREEINFQIDSGIQIDEDSIKITYLDKEGKEKDVTEYTIENNQIKVAFESHKENEETAGDSIKIELEGTLQEVKDYTNRISYAGYLRDYETGEDTKINLGNVTTTEETINVRKVSIGIKEINEENEITTGSHFEIRKKETGEVIQSFITDGEIEPIRKLEPMVEYVIVETKPIPGYTTAEEVIFTLDETGEIVIQKGAEQEENTILIRDYNTKIQVEIKDEITKEYVIGPKWQIIRKTEQDGEIVEEVVTEWTSEGKEVQIEKLPIGEYTLREIAIGEDTGYVTIDDTIFYIQDTKELQILEIEQKVSKVKIHLKDIETEEYVEGATLQIIKRIKQEEKVEEKIIREWTTETDGKLQVKLPVGEYIIRETKLPENSGYATIEEVELKVEDTQEEQEVEIKQDFTKVKIEVIDEETKEKIDQLEISIMDKKTNEVVAKTKIDEEEENSIPIIEKEDGYYVERLPIGEYSIKEKTPEGYKEVEEKAMEVKDTPKLQIVQIENKRLIYDMQVEKRLSSIMINGEKKELTTGEIQKIEVPESKIKTEDINLEYVIRISNVGETKATIGKIIDNIPDGLKLISKDWKQEGNQAIYYAEKEELEPGKSKEVNIILKWENKEINFGEKKNIAKLKGSTNPFNYEDKNKDNDIGEVTTIFSIKTGVKEDSVMTLQIITTILIASITISLIAGIEIMFLKGRNHKA